VINKTILRALIGSALFAGGAMSHSASAAMLITEVDAAGSSASYGADWFELTNTGNAAVDITGWKMDDSSAAFGSAVSLRGITSIGAGKSVVFFEGNATGTTDATIQANFISAWYGSNVPAGLSFGFYGGSGVGLNTGGDGVTIFNNAGNTVASVTFGTAGSGTTFDNTAGLNNGSITQHSAVGVNGAFLSANGAEIGSPGVAAAPVPLPAAAWLLFSGLGLLTPMARRRS